MATVTAPALDNLVREQSTLVGGSELHHVLNLEPYGCARQLAYKKSGAKPDFPFHGNQHTHRGIELEDLIAKWYAEKTGRQVQRVAGSKAGIAKRDRDFAFLGCHADREILNPNGLVLLNGTAIAPGRPGILSIKAPGEYAMRKLLEAQAMPLGYVAQLQYEISIYRRDWGSYAFGGIVDDAIEIVFFDQLYNEAQAEDIRSLVKLWWARFVKGEAFEVYKPLPPEDPRCASCPWRTTCQGEAILKLAEVEAGKTEDGDTIEKDEDAEWVGLIKEYVRRLEAEKVAGTLKDATTQRILAKMGERVALVTPAGKVYAKPQVQLRMQSKEVGEILTNQAAIAQRIVEAGLDFQNPKVLSAAMTLIGEIAALPGLIQEKFTVRSAFRAVRPYPTKAIKAEALSGDGL